jgi:putative phage-type endonuclease
MLDVQQGSDAWLALRAGKVTASRVADVIAKTKSGWGASRANYMAELICERLTGQPTPSFSNAAMQHGTLTEPEARAAYEFRFNCDVAQIGFVAHPIIAMSGASPDGLVDDDGLIEIKCPNSATHIETLLSGNMPSKYETQMLWQLACTQRKWCDFVSYDPRLPPAMQMFVRRLYRDDGMIAELEKLVCDFLSEVDAKVAALRNQYEQKEAAE